MKEKFASSSLKDFVDVVELYRSGSGAVYKARFKYDNQLYVLKEKKLPELGKAKDIMNEVKLLEQLRHSNIVQCEGWFRDHERRTVVIVLEYCEGGDLDQLLASMRQKKESFSELEVWTIFEQLCSGVKHLHSNGIIHRDIKPLNIFMDKDHHTFKIGDLGVSRQVSEQTVLVQTFYGTPLYLSPELIENRAYNEKTDVWSLGVLLYELCTLQPPFKASSLMALARLILQGDYTPLPEDKYSSAMSKCVKWLLTKEFSKRPSIAMVEELVRKQRLALSQSTSSSNSQVNLNNFLPPPMVNNVQRQPGPGLAADQGIASYIQQHGDDAEDGDQDADSLDGQQHHHRLGQAGVVALAHYKQDRQRSGSADTRSTASHDDHDHTAETLARDNDNVHPQPQRSNINQHNNNDDNHRNRRVQMALDFPGYGGDEAIPLVQQPQQRKRPSTARPTSRHAVSSLEIQLPVDIIPPPIIATSQDRPQNTSHSQDKAKEREVPINMARAVAKLRREAIRYRKLLQMRDFFSFSTNHVSSDSNDNGNDKNRRNDGIANGKLKETEGNIALLEYALDHHRLTESEAIRLDIVMVDKAPEPPPPAIKEKPAVIRNDNMPVYLQTDPRQRNNQDSVRQNSPTNNNNNRLGTKFINLDIAKQKRSDSHGLAILPVRSNSFAAMTGPRSRRAIAGQHAVNDSEIIALQPQKEASAASQEERQQQTPLRRRHEHGRAKPSQLFDINVHFDRQAMVGTDPASPLQQLLANINSKRSPINSSNKVAVAEEIAGLELPSMSPKNEERNKYRRQQSLVDNVRRPASAAPVFYHTHNNKSSDMIKSDKAMLYKHARHMSDIMVVLEKGARYHNHEQGGVEAALHGDRPITAALTEHIRKARASRSRSRTRSRSSGEDDEKRVSPNPRQSAIARKQRMLLMGQVRPRTASAAAAGANGSSGDSMSKKEKWRQDKGIMIRQQTSYNIITGDDHD